MKHCVTPKSLVVFLGVLLILSTSMCQGDATIPPMWQVELCESLNTLKAGNFFDPTIQNLQTFALSLQDSEAAIQAILELFITGTEGTEIFWWKSENRAARCFVLLLKLCMESQSSPDGKISVSDVETQIKRFNEQERRERSEEFAFVLEYGSALAGVLAEIIQQRDPEKYHMIYKVHFDALAKVRIGKPLPKWCKHAEIDEDSNEE